MLLHLLRLQSKALPLQPSLPLPSAVPGRPSLPRVPPSFALQLRPLQLWDTSSSQMQWLILRMRRQGLQLLQLLPKLLPLLLWARSPAALCFSVLRTGTRRSSSLR